MKKRKTFLMIALVLILLAGIVITVYPIVSTRYAESVRSEIRTEYTEILEENVDDGSVDILLQEAREYNRKLFTGEILRTETADNGYFEMLKVDGTDVMCYVSIPKINIDLPVFHGTGEDILNYGVGHMAQTSLPVGGENTHCVLSAHSGMASSPMFSDLEMLEIGDYVYITVLGETLTYQVYQEPYAVLPDAISTIKIQSGQDILTLVTCTPLGVNTHRLLVHCQRVEPPETPEETQTAPTETVAQEQPESVYQDQFRRQLYIGIGLALLILAFALVIRSVMGSRKSITADKKGEVQEGAESHGEQT